MNPELITILRFGDDSQVVEWFQVLRATEEATSGDSTAFVERLREQTGDFDHAMVEDFLRTLEASGDVGQELGELLELQSQMPDLYWAYQQAGTTGEPAADPYDWVTGSQRAHLSGLWGDNWPTVLDGRLDESWGEGWRSHPADYKQAWLDQLVSEWESQAQRPRAAGEPAQPAEPVGDGPYDWVPEQSRQRMSEAWGTEWETYLGQQLDYRWGEGWQSNPTEHKQAWLETLMPELFPEPVAEQAVEQESLAQAEAQVEPENEPDVPLTEGAAAAVEQAVNEVLAEELDKLGEDGDLSAEDLEDIMAEVRGMLLDEATE